MAVVFYTVHVAFNDAPRLPMMVYASDRKEAAIKTADRLNQWPALDAVEGYPREVTLVSVVEWIAATEESEDLLEHRIYKRVPTKERVSFDQFWDEPNIESGWYVLLAGSDMPILFTRDYNKANHMRCRLMFSSVYRECVVMPLRFGDMAWEGIPNTWPHLETCVKAENHPA